MILSNIPSNVIRFLDLCNIPFDKIDKLKEHASFRCYYRASGKYQTHLVMDVSAEPNPSDLLDRFVKYGDAMRVEGISVPEVFDVSDDRTLALVEDFGLMTVEDALNGGIIHENDFYDQILELFPPLQLAKASLSNRSPTEFIEEACLFLDWYAPEKQYMRPILEELLKEEVYEDALINSVEGVFVHKDIHLSNIMWLPDRIGLARFGIIDHQDAYLGHPSYDILALIESAQRPLNDCLRHRVLHRFSNICKRPLEEVHTQVRLLGIQRSLRLIGLFERLAVRDGKTDYRKFIGIALKNLYRSSPVCPKIDGWLRSNFS